ARRRSSSSCNNPIPACRCTACILTASAISADILPVRVGMAYLRLRQNSLVVLRYTAIHGVPLQPRRSWWGVHRMRRTYLQDLVGFVVMRAGCDGRHATRPHGL